MKIQLPHFKDWHDLATYNHLNTAVWIFCLEDHTFWWGNEAAQKFWEVQSLHDFISRDFSDDSKTVRERLKDIFQSASQGETIEDNWTLYPSGVPKMVILRMTPVFVEDEKRALLIEASPQIQEGLDPRAKRILEAVRNTPLMISTYGLTGELLAQNPAAASTHISNSTELVNLRNRYNSPTLVTDILQYARVQKGFTGDIKVLTKHGMRWHKITTETALDPISGNQVIVLTEEDVTELVEAQEELQLLNLTLEQRVEERTRKLSLARIEAENANKSKSNFLATMSHELRTPLNAIIGFSEILKLGVYGPINEDQNIVLGDIHTSGSHLLALINELLDASTIDRKKQDLNETPFHTQDVIDYCEAIFRLEAQKKKQKFSVFNKIGDISVLGDARRIIQILMNLLNNASKYTDNGGEITLTIYLDNAVNLVFEVSDTGIGISKSQLKEVLKAFTQADVSSTWTAGSGVGLGLYIASQLISAHQGEINIKSEKGSGTTVAVSLPTERILEKPAKVLL